jgi:hypothetical protein
VDKISTPQGCCLSGICMFWSLFQEMINKQTIQLHVHWNRHGFPKE